MVVGEPDFVRASTAVMGVGVAKCGALYAIDATSHLMSNELPDRVPDAPRHFRLRSLPLVDDPVVRAYA